MYKSVGKHRALAALVKRSAATSQPDAPPEKSESEPRPLQKTDRSIELSQSSWLALSSNVTGHEKARAHLDFTPVESMVTTAPKRLKTSLA